jgi:hypothetical protein
MLIGIYFPRLDPALERVVKTRDSAIHCVGIILARGPGKDVPAEVSKNMLCAVESWEYDIGHVKSEIQKIARGIL